MSKEEIEIIEAETCTTVDESFVKQAREILDGEGRSEIANMIKILMDHYEKTSGKVICRFQSNCGKFQRFSLCRTILLKEA